MMGEKPNLVDRRMWHSSHLTSGMLPCAGLVGIVPALGILTKEQNPAGGPIIFPWWKLMLWSLALAFLGVFIAVPLRTQTVIKVRSPCCM